MEHLYHAIIVTSPALLNDTLYALAMDVPDQTVVISSPGIGSGNGKISGVELLGSTEKVTWKQRPKGLQIVPSKNYPTAHAVAYRITFE